MKVSIVTLALSTVVAVNESLDSEIFSTADKSFRNAYEEMFQPENDSRYNILYILYMYKGSEQIKYPEIFSPL